VNDLHHSSPGRKSPDSFGTCRNAYFNVSQGHCQQREKRRGERRHTHQAPWQDAAARLFAWTAALPAHIDPKPALAAAAFVH
jgi:hypothetical protein